MLYLSRLTNESIVIGDNIEIRVARIDKNIVCLGIQAPREVTIHRKELHDEIRAIIKKSNPQRKVIIEEN